MRDEKCITVSLEGIRGEIEILIHERFSTSESVISENVEGNFFGERGMMNPRELTYLAYLLEMRYGIRFGVKEYDDQRFYNLAGLSEIIMEMVGKKLRCEMADE